MATTAAEQVMLNGPALTPPPGVKSNFVNPPNMDFIVILTISICTSFSTIAILLRLYTKLIVIRKVVFEDYVVVLGWLMAGAETGSAFMTTRYGGGSHQWNVRVKDFFEMLHWVNTATIIYNPTLFVIKFAILLQCLRIFVPNRKTNMGMYIAVHIVIVAILIFYLVMAAFNIFLCRPREKFWDPLLTTTGSCYNFDASMQATGLFNIISDFAILLLPIWPIWKLQVPLKKKLRILAVFATGVLACAASIVRSYATFRLVNSDDKSYNLIMMGCWKFIEIAIGIVISCLPILPRLFQGFGSRIYRAFSFRSKSSDMTPSGAQTTHTSIKRMSEKKDPDGYMDLSDMRSEVSGQSSPFHEHELGRVVANDFSQTPPAPTPEDPAPKWEGRQSEKQQGQIVRTTHIETEIQSDAVICIRADLERQQLGW